MEPTQDEFQDSYEYLSGISGLRNRVENRSVAAAVYSLALYMNNAFDTAYEVKMVHCREPGFVNIVWDEIRNSKEEIWDGIYTVEKQVRECIQTVYIPNIPTAEAFLLSSYDDVATVVETYKREVVRRREIRSRGLEFDALNSVEYFLYKKFVQFRHYQMLVEEPWVHFRGAFEKVENTEILKRNTKKFIDESNRLLMSSVDLELYRNRYRFMIFFYLQSLGNYSRDRLDRYMTGILSQTYQPYSDAGDRVSAPELLHHLERLQKKRAPYRELAEALGIKSEYSVDLVMENLMSQASGGDGLGPMFPFDSTFTKTEYTKIMSNLTFQSSAKRRLEFPRKRKRLRF